MVSQSTRLTLHFQKPNKSQVTPPRQTRQNCLVCVASASVAWNGFPTTQDCRRQKTWSLNTLIAIVQFTIWTQTGLSCRVWRAVWIGHNDAVADDSARSGHEPYETTWTRWLSWGSSSQLSFPRRSCQPVSWTWYWTRTWTHSPSRLAWSEGWRSPGAQSTFTKMMAP